MTMRKISSGDYEPDDYEPKKEPYCKCGYPDMPGQCPGWRNCPMCAEDEDERA